MTCPVCGGKTRVLDSEADSESVYRRRKCVECDHRFYTTESESDRGDIYAIRENKRKSRKSLKKG